MSNWLSEYRLNLTVDEYLEVLFETIEKYIKKAGTEHPDDINQIVISVTEYLGAFLSEISKIRDNNVPF